MQQLEQRKMEQVKANDNIIEGYALRFNSLSKDLGGFREVISPTALKKTDLSDVRCFIDHDSSLVLGRTANDTLKITVDEVGLHFRCELPDTTYARDLNVSVTRGDINECSFGFNVSDGGESWKRDGDNYIRTINTINELAEISIVSIPAYAETNAEIAQRSLKKVVNELQKRKLTLSLELAKIKKG
ncbi:HK97 family phage prohead protease [Brochothrix thermosphacta]|uniref:HK97 family phage prohead protease n=1 Tax=Brochothrix thermosphacta TaxID=2756 RepID=UPI0019693D8F|nr:HK97 family phage prohead protease [Brochothrix thermosphacta]